MQVNKSVSASAKLSKVVIISLYLALLFPFISHASTANNTKEVTDSVKQTVSSIFDRTEVIDENATKNDSAVSRIDSIPLAEVPGGEIMLLDSIAQKEIPPYDINFNPNPTRAVWLSALFPGLGQVYNRRYWKLPIVAGGFLGISYALSWNNRMLSDYTIAYRDATDNDPNTKSYLDFFSSNVKESDLDMTWLTKTLKSRKDFYRRNRDLSIICMAGMYLLCMVDAYVDASLSHFDISPDLSINWAPTFIDSNRNGVPSVGLQWAINF